MWGKWAQNQDKTQTNIVTSEKVFYELLTRQGIEVQSLIFPNDEVAFLSWKYSEENVAAGKNVNVAVAAYVTTQARLNPLTTRRVHWTRSKILSCIILIITCSRQAVLNEFVEYSCCNIYISVG